MDDNYEIEFFEDGQGKYSIKVTKDKNSLSLYSLEDFYAYDIITIDVNKLNINNVKIVMDGLKNILRSVEIKMSEIKKKGLIL